MQTEIKSENELKAFSEKYYAFHDSCVKEFCYVSGAYADEEGLSPFNYKRILRLVLQGCAYSNCTLELEFSGLNHLKLFPIPEEYTC